MYVGVVSTWVSVESETKKEEKANALTANNALSDVVAEEEEEKKGDNCGSDGGGGPKDTWKPVIGRGLWGP